jgi:predicted Zn finger-like uncharacterized protein
MKFECDSCHAQYMIADEKVGKRGVKVKCKKCQHVIIVRPGAGDAAKGGAGSEKSSDKAAEKAAAKAEKRAAAEKAAADKAAREAAAAEAAREAAASERAEREEAERAARDEAERAASSGLEDAPTLAVHARPDFEVPVEKPQATLNQAPPPGFEPGGPARDDEDIFTSGPTDPGALAPPPPGPPLSDEEDPSPETTGPNLKPAPVSMFGDTTQLTQNPMHGDGPRGHGDQMSVPEEPPPDDRTELAQPPQMTAPPPPAEPTVVARQELPPEAPPPTGDTSLGAEEPRAHTAEDELGDQLSGAFNAMFDESQNVAPPEESNDQRGPTRVLDLGAVDELRKAASRSNELDPGMFEVGREGGDKTDAAGADDGPAEQVWHVAIDDQDVGPLSLAEVGRHIEAGRMDRDTLVWKVGMDDWLPAGEVPSVRALFDKVPMPRIPRLEDEAPARGRSFDVGSLEDLPPGGTPFDSSEEDPSWRPHGLTEVYQAANLAEAAGMGGLGGVASAMSGPSKAPSASPSLSASAAEPEWRPGAASALASLVQDEIKRIDNGPPPASDDDLSPADDASINAPLFGGLGGKDLEAGPAVGDPIPRATSMPPSSLGGGYEPPVPSYPPPQPFLSTPPQRDNKLSPLMLGGIAGGVFLLLVVVIIAIAVGGKGEDPKILVVDGKPYIMGPNNQLIPIGSESKSETKADTNAAAAAPAQPSPPAEAAPAENKAEAASEPEKVAMASTPGADEGPKKIVEKATERAKAAPKPTEKKDPPEKKESAPPVNPKCDPVLDFDCKPAAAGAKAAATEVKESLTTSDVLVVVKSNMSSVDACARKNKASGVIKMAWKIQPNGKTSDVQVTDSTFAGTPVGGCVENAIKNWKFPASKVATPVRFPMKLDG